MKSLTQFMRLSMDLTKMTLESLKALVFDKLVAKEKAAAEFMAVAQEIDRRQAAKIDVFGYLV